MSFELGRLSQRSAAVTVSLPPWHPFSSGGSARFLSSSDHAHRCIWRSSASTARRPRNRSRGPRLPLTQRGADSTATHDARASAQRARQLKQVAFVSAMVGVTWTGSGHFVEAPLRKYVQSWHAARKVIRSEGDTFYVLLI